MVALPVLALAACGDQTSSDTKTLAATTPAQTGGQTATQTRLSTTAPLTTPPATTTAPLTTPPATTTAPLTTPPATAPAVTTQPAPSGAATTRASLSSPANPPDFLPPTPQCTGKNNVTAAQTEGPYFKASSPQRTSLLEVGIPGTKMVLTGYVLTRSCKPVAHALLDFWQADGNGVYDNSGFKLRGHQFTDENGRFTLETVVPGLYPGRTRHIHVKVQAPNQPVLTSQLYFPGEARNQSDSIFNPELLMTLADTAGSKQATFNFVLNLS